MIITGRLAADAGVRRVKDKEVVRFRLVQNERYRGSGGYVDDFQYYECSYWQQVSIAASLKKGSILELCGHLKQRAWIDGNGQAQCELAFHVDHLKILGSVSYHANEGQGDYADPTYEKLALPTISRASQHT